MVRTFNRQPLQVNTPSNSDVKHYFQNNFNFKGLMDSKNYMQVDQESFADCNNVYVDEKGLLKSRPGIKIKVVTTKINGEEVKLANIIDVWNFDKVTVYHSELNGQYYLTFVNENFEESLQELTEQNVKLILVDKKIFVFTEVSFSYYSLENNVYGNAEDFIYIPTTKKYVNGILTNTSSDILVNKFTTKEVYEHVYDLTTGFKYDFLKFVNENVTVTINEETYEVKFVLNNEKVFVGKHLELSDNLDSLQIADNGTMILEYLQSNNNIINYSFDGLVFEQLSLPEDVLNLTGQLTYLTQDGFHVIVFKKDGPYIKSIVKTIVNSDGTASYKYTDWTNLCKYIDNTFYTNSNIVYSTTFEQHNFCANFVTDDCFAFTLSSDYDYVNAQNVGYKSMKCIYCNNGKLSEKKFYDTKFLTYEKTFDLGSTGYQYTYDVSNVSYKNLSGAVSYTVSVSITVNEQDDVINWNIIYSDGSNDSGTNNYISSEQFISDVAILLIDYVGNKRNCTIKFLARGTNYPFSSNNLLLKDSQSVLYRSANYIDSSSAPGLQQTTGKINIYRQDNMFTCIIGFVGEYVTSYWGTNYSEFYCKFNNDDLTLLYRTYSNGKKCYIKDSDTCYDNTNKTWLLALNFDDNTSSLISCKYSMEYPDKLLTKEKVFDTYEKFFVFDKSQNNLHLLGTKNLYCNFDVRASGDWTPDTSFSKIKLLFESVPIAVYSGKLYLTDSDKKVLHSTISLKDLTMKTYVDGETNYILPDDDVELDQIYLSKDKTLYITDTRRNNNGEYLWYLPKINNQEFDYDITNIHPISANEVAIFLPNSVYYVVYDDNAQGYRYYKTKIQVGCKKGTDILTTFDGKYTLFTSERGLVAMSYQQFIESTEQSLTYLSDAINKTFYDYITETNSQNIVKLHKYNYWIFVYKQDSNKGFLFDTRTNTWWPVSNKNNVTKIITVDNKINLLTDNRLHRLDTKDVDYFDYIFVKDKLTRVTIPWNILSQKLHLNALNYYKHIDNITFNSSHDVVDIDKAKFKETDLGLKLQVNCYRQKIDGNVNTDDYTAVKYKVNVLRTVIQRLNYFKVNEFQYLLSHDDDSILQIPLSLTGLTVKYKIGGQIR